VTAKVLHRVFPRAYAVGSPKITLLGRVKAAVLACGDDSFASHRTAAWIWALGISMRGIEVTVAREDAPAIKGIKTRKSSFAPGETTRRHGIPVTSLIRTLIDLAAVEHAYRVEQALDHAIRMDPRNLDAVRTRFLQLARRGRKGTRVMRRLLNARDGEYIPPGSTFEAMLQRALRDHGVRNPERQVKVADGDFIAYIDFAYSDVKLGLECDSYAHHSSRPAHEKDRVRRRRLAKLGWQIAEFTYEEVKHEPAAVAREVTELLRERS
jgi:very-short-patch-repair endonuclease